VTFRTAEGRAARRPSPPAVIAAGGVDPSGGAGTTRDTLAIAACGAFPVAVPTALAIQTGKSYLATVPVPAPRLLAMLACAAASHRVAAVKVGMVGSGAAARAVARFLASLPPAVPVVIDPVLASSSGGTLLPPEALPAFRRLLSRGTLVTPNLPEAEALLGRALRTPAEAEAGARELSDATGAAVLLKGGHFPWRGWRGTDLLAAPGRETLRLPPPPGVALRGARGTGCALASAAAARLALGDDLPAAVAAAKALLSLWLSSSFAGLDGRRYLPPPPVR
jgi:hydroxymethylpyrimidine/phosphomethylpyrimidine kinase